MACYRVGGTEGSTDRMDLLKEVTIIFITSTIIWPRVKQQGGNLPCPSTENWIKGLLNMPRPSEQDLVFP